MGGGVALTLAVSGSPSLAGLIVAGAVDGPGREFPGRRVAMSAGASASARTLQVLARRRSELIPSRRAARVAARIAFGSPADRADVDLTASTMAAMSRVNMAAMSSNMVDYDVRAGLATLTVPAVVVVGSRDRAAPPRRARAMAARIPGAELVVMDGAGHMLMLERRPAFNELARTFARRVSA
jgi:pimeloyl-ACP methyl ester carboxylesterase